jgi:beta-lactamase regulating signal transducer with metallopeptidase domain
MLCVLYVNVIGAFFGVVGLLIERVYPLNWSRRWIWVGVIAISMFVPGYARVHHNSSVMAAFDHNSAIVSWMDPAWFLRAESLNIWILRVWLTATALLFVWGITHIGRVSLLIRSARKKAKDAPATIDGVPVVVTDSLGPATVGLLRSRVVLPRWVLALPGLQRQYIVKHEAEHRRAHDAHLLFFLSLGLLLAPWNIALWWHLRRLRLAVEMDCDNRVVSALGDPHAYGELLFRVAEASSRGPQLQPAFLGSGLLEQRLRALLEPSQLKRFQKFLLPALAVALLILTLKMPHPILGHSTMTHSSMTATR